MTDIRRLMGRLNPATCRFDIGRGGIPELTPQDIAAALGFVRDEFAREVFCSVWWPDGARLTRDALLRMIAFRQRAEIDKQQRAIQVLRLDLHIASDDAAARNYVTHNDRRTLDALRSRVEAAKSSAWPANAEVYPRIRVAALNELVEPAHCGECGGRGEMMVGEVVRTCHRCDGRGTISRSDVERAKSIAVGYDTYRKHWRIAYDWTYTLLRDAEARGIREIRGAIGEAA